jgi:hypothetical protein
MHSTTCTAKNCEEKVYCKNLCRYHYYNGKDAKRKYIKRGERKNIPCGHLGCKKQVSMKFAGIYYCTQHYQRMKRLGSTEDSKVDMSKHLTIKERIKYKSIVNKETGCWEWQGTLDKGGYGTISINNHPQRVHRASFEAFVHKIVPKSLQVLHECDNRKCVNPEHLFLGNHQDNMDDMTSKKRHCFGEKRIGAKLTDKKVREIKKAFKKFVPFDIIGFSQQCGVLAEKYNVSGKLIRNIYHGKAWKHIKL